jgi:hypothetical protein
MDSIKLLQQVKEQLPFYMPYRHTVGVEVYLHSFLSFALDGGEWSASCLLDCTTPNPLTKRERKRDTIASTEQQAGWTVANGIHNLQN